jgi:hypothetical protein
VWSIASLTVLGLLVGVTVVAIRSAERSQQGVGDARAWADENGVATGDRSPSGPVADLLQNLTEATTSGDLDAFLAQFDPKDAALRSRWAARFSTLGQLALTVTTWGAVDDDLVGVPPQSPNAPTGARVIGVDLVTGLVDYDKGLSGESGPATAVHQSFPLTVAPVGDRWVVVGDDDPARPKGVRRTVEAQPWASGKAHAIARPAVLVMGDVDLDGLSRLADRLVAVLPGVQAEWPEADSTQDGGVIVYAMDDARFRGEWFGPDAATALGTVTSLAGDGGVEPWMTAAPRLIVTSHLLELKDAALDTWLRTELTHLIRWRQDMAGGALPTWMLAGAGDYTAYRAGRPTASASAVAAAYGLEPDTVAAIRRGTWRPRLDLDPEPFAPGAAGAAAGRDSAFLTCLYVADRFGDDKLRRLVERAADQGDSRAAGAESAAVRAVLQTDRAHVIAQVGAWAHRLLTGVTARKGPVERPELPTSRPTRYRAD